MNKKLLIIVIGLILIICAAFGYVAWQNAKTETSEPEPTTETSQTEQPKPAANAATGSYVDYSEEKLAQTSGTRLLFFHAPWCPQCRALESSIKSSDIPQEVTIFKVDYDSNQALRQKYGVKIQTTVVKIDDQGNEVKKFVAYDDPSFKSVNENLLQ